MIRFIKLIKKETADVFINLGLACKYLTILCGMSFILIAVSIFHPELDATGNMVTIRTAFSSIVGYLLEKTTKTCDPNPVLLKMKVVIVGTISIMCMIIAMCAYIFNTDVNNPSLILIKNLLFSSIGFLTSANKDFCGGKFK